jgi:hypothetical protein
MPHQQLVPFSPSSSGRVVVVVRKESGCLKKKMEKNWEDGTFIYQIALIYHLYISLDSRLD